MVEDVAKLVAGVDVMVAGVEVAVVFQGQPPAAGLGEQAQGRWLAHPDAQLDFEKLDKDFVQAANEQPKEQERPELDDLFK